MDKNDKRIGLTSEALNNIKLVKLYSWVELFYKKIDKNR